MNPYVNEDVMFQRLKDVQREAENRRLRRPRRPTLVDLIASVFSGLVAGSPRQPARPSWVELDDERETATDVA